MEFVKPWYSEINPLWRHRNCTELRVHNNGLRMSVEYSPDQNLRRTDLYIPFYTFLGAKRFNHYIYLSFVYLPRIYYLNYPDQLPCWPRSSVGRAPVDLFRRSWVQTPLGPNFLWSVGTPKFPLPVQGFGVSAVLPTPGTLTLIYIALFRYHGCYAVQPLYRPLYTLKNSGKADNTQ